MAPATFNGVTASGQGRAVGVTVPRNDTERVLELLKWCVNEDATDLFKAVVAYGLAYKDCKTDKWERARHTTGDLAPPPLEARFAFVSRADGLHGIAYSAICCADIELDLAVAARSIPGYVTPALLTAPPHPDNPYASTLIPDSPWKQLGERTVTKTMCGGLRVLDEGFASNPAATRGRSMLQILHHGVAQLREQIENEELSEYDYGRCETWTVERFAEEPWGLSPRFVRISVNPEELPKGYMIALHIVNPAKASTSQTIAPDTIAGVRATPADLTESLSSIRETFGEQLAAALAAMSTAPKTRRVNAQKSQRGPPVNNASRLTLIFGNERSKEKLALAERRTLSDGTDGLEKRRALTGFQARRDRVDELEQKVSLTEQRVAQAEQRATEAERRAGALENRVEELENTVSEIMKMLQQRSG
ncbi:hypothetical protein VTJ49DRAFT_6623 [Mycothermus thermophilus]|uniref:Uncharacterized protein n=1 Tax=Humicola insolens TaxID=85995 RepID=A0ABR3VIR0_HUMIN